MPGVVTVQFDAAIWLASLSISELKDVVQLRRVCLPWLDTDPVWAEPYLASLRTAWEQVGANSNPAELRMTVDLSGGLLLEWLYKNLFAKFLQFALLEMFVDEGWVRSDAVGRVVADIDEGRDVKTVTLEDHGGFGCKRATINSLDPVAAVVTALVRSCVASNPEMEIGLLSDLTPYVVGGTPQGQWMSVDRALLYRDAGVTCSEARRWEFGAAANRPTTDTLATLAGLHGTSR